MVRISRIIIGIFVVIGIIVIITNLWNGYGIEKSNPNNYATIGDIPTPDGYERIGTRGTGTCFIKELQ